MFWYTNTTISLSNGNTGNVILVFSMSRVTMSTYYVLALYHYVPMCMISGEAILHRLKASKACLNRLG